MGTRYFALVLGIFYLLIGMMGLVPALIQPSSAPEPVTLDLLYGDLLGIFPVNIVHTVIHLAVGVWGILAYRSYDGARSLAVFTGIAFGVLFLMGLIPGLRVLFGIAPLHGADIWLHLATSLSGLYFGLIAPRPVERVVEKARPKCKKPPAERASVKLIRSRHAIESQYQT